MIVTPNLEEELSIERSVREVQRCDDNQTLRSLCEALVRQSWHQGKLLSQAVDHIASLDIESGWEKRTYTKRDQA